MPSNPQVSMELDQTIYDLGRLRDAVVLLGRSSKNWSSFEISDP